MGFSVKFNWVLQTTAPVDIAAGQQYDFIKAGNRVFPLDTPIDLIDLERSAVAKIKVREFTNSEQQTAGSYQVIKVYSGTEKAVLTNYWLENQ